MTIPSLDPTSRWRTPFMVVLFLFLFACADNEGDLARCELEGHVLADGPRDFSPGLTGHGNFGKWRAGPHGLPEYEYTLAQESDKRADWPNTENRTRRDHWHLVGNDRLNVLAFNEGYVDVYLQDFGNESWTRFDAASGNFGAGYSILADDTDKPGGNVWSSAYAWRPKQSLTQRFFGMGYVRYVTCDGNFRISRTIWTPEGNHPVVLADVTVENISRKRRNVRHFEMWDVNRHYVQQQEVRSGVLMPSLPAIGDETRNKLNADFRLRAESTATYAMLHHLPLTAPTGLVVTPLYVNPQPSGVYLTRLDGGAARYHTDAQAFWGNGDPASVANLTPGDLAETGAYGQPGGLVGESAHSLARGEKVRLRYAFGFTDAAAKPPSRADLLESLPEGLAEHAEAWRDHLVYFDADPAAFPDGEVDAESLRREMAWHAYYLRAQGGYQNYYGRFVVNQGSAYWYHQGLDGALRDFVFTAVALTYTDPALAREILLYASQMRFEATKSLGYTVSGNGILSDAIIHDQPSDLELFFWWGLAEYVFATGDASILEEKESFWPKHESTPRPIHEHISIGARYLVDEIGVGPNGLLRIASGDWDDSITFFADSRADAKAVGESVANSAMAAFIAPWAAALVAPWDATAATDLQTLGEEQRSGTAAQWTGDWYRRAWFGADKPFGDDVIFLFSNALALIGEIPTAAQAKTLLDNLGKYLEDPSTTSLFQFWYFDPPDTTMPGVTDPGASNPIISGLGVWGYAKADPARAWHLVRHLVGQRFPLHQHSPRRGTNVGVHRHAHARLPDHELQRPQRSPHRHAARDGCGAGRAHGGRAVAGRAGHTSAHGARPPFRDGYAAD
jgi:hypothetical protein